MTCNSWNFIYTAPYKTRLQAGLQQNYGLNILRPKEEIERQEGHKMHGARNKTVRKVIKANN